MIERLKYKEIEDGKCFEVWHKSNRVHRQQTNRKYVVLTDLTKAKEEFSCICANFSKDGVKKMDSRPTYFGFWCLMTNTTKLD